MRASRSRARLYAAKELSLKKKVIEGSVAKLQSLSCIFLPPKRVTSDSFTVDRVYRLLF